MRMAVLYLLGVTMALACPLIANAQNITQTEAERNFRDVDLINDGRIDMGEFDMYHLRLFKRLDKDNDGAVTINECIGNCFTPQPGENAAAKSGTLHYKFDTIDADSSGRIIEYEYILYAREHFDDYDTNNDGFIDINEFCAFYDQAMPCTFAAAPQNQGEK